MGCLRTPALEYPFHDQRAGRLEAEAPDAVTRLVRPEGGERRIQVAADHVRCERNAIGELVRHRAQQKRARARGDARVVDVEEDRAAVVARSRAALSMRWSAHLPAKNRV
jgi:hypothetical protein